MPYIIASTAASAPPAQQATNTPQRAAVLTALRSRVVRVPVLAKLARRAPDEHDRRLLPRCAVRAGEPL